METKNVEENWGEFQLESRIKDLILLGEHLREAQFISRRLKIDLEQVTKTGLVNAYSDAYLRLIDHTRGMAERLTALTDPSLKSISPDMKAIISDEIFKLENFMKDL